MMRCQDCGNQAKKDCFYYRCRTCCKGRGFQCQTHIKSTWVPVSTRRPTPHHLLPSSSPPPPPSSSNPNKRFRQSTTAPSSSSGLGGDFPAEVSVPATFVSLRVRSGDNEVDQYAYQTSVSIGGHVFKGILYDQGPEMLNLYGSSTRGGDHQTSASGTYGLLEQRQQQQQPIVRNVTADAYSPSSSSNPPTLFNAFALGAHFFPYPKS